MSGVSSCRGSTRPEMVMYLRGSVGVLAVLLLMLTGRAFPQQQDVARYAAPVAGKPLCTLRIEVTGFRNDEGKAGGVVFAAPAGWPEDTTKSVVHGGFPIVNRQATELFQVPPGRYGVAVIHDENSNQKLDRNFLGIPKEGFGFANNPRVLLSAPSFQAAAVTVACPVTQIAIRLIYK